MIPLKGEVSNRSWFSMKIEFDPAKDTLNRRKHGFSLALAEEMDWDDAMIERDDRFDYGEIRLNAIVPRGDALYCVIFTERSETIRVISLRLATNTEKSHYVNQFR
jgi:uncharacterized DUF497 family protein